MCTLVVPLSKLTDGGAAVEGPVAEALESKDAGDLGKKLSDAWPDGFACNVD